MKKQEYIKPETVLVEMESCAILAASGGGVTPEGDGIDMPKTFETDGNAGAARSRRRNLWEE